MKSGNGRLGSAEGYLSSLVTFVGPVISILWMSKPKVYQDDRKGIWETH